MSYKSARLATGMSVREAAKRLLVTDAAIYMWETGQMNPRADRLPEIAALYGVSVDELLAGKEEDHDLH